MSAPSITEALRDMFTPEHTLFCVLIWGAFVIHLWQQRKHRKADDQRWRAIEDNLERWLEGTVRPAKK